MDIQIGSATPSGGRAGATLRRSTRGCASAASIGRSPLTSTSSRRSLGAWQSEAQKSKRNSSKSGASRRSSLVRRLSSSTVGPGPEAAALLVVAGRRSPLLRRYSSPPLRTSSLAAELTSEQRKAIERLADYPRRVERLRRLWADIHIEERRVHGRGSTGRSQSKESTSSGARGPLTAAQIQDLMSRDITPEDYELLLLLDEGVKKAKTFSPDVAAALPRAVGSSWVDGECRICLCALEEDEDVRMLPGCGHCFHAPCAQRWLTSSKATCPLCGQEQAKQEKVLEAFRQFDENGDGLFELSEMRRVLAALDPAVWSLERVDCLFNAIDANRDGKVNIEEFVNWVFAGGQDDQQRRLCDAMDI